MPLNRLDQNVGNLQSVLMVVRKRNTTPLHCQGLLIIAEVGETAGMDEARRGSDLLAACAPVADPRSRPGRRHPLPAILALATAAMRSGARSLYAIAQWGRLQPPETVAALGVTREQTPTVSPLHRVFRALDATAFATALSQWARTPGGDDTAAIAIAGKGLRGIHGEALPGVRLVAGYRGGVGLVLAQAGGPGHNG